MAKQKLTRQRLRQIIREEKQKLEEATGDPSAREAVRALDLKQRFGFENQRSPENTIPGGNEIYKSPNEPWHIRQEDYSVQVVDQRTGGSADFRDQKMLHTFLRAVL